MSLASSYQGLHVSENNSPSNDNITENSMAGKPDSENNGKEITHPHSRKGSSYSIMVPDPVLSASKVDRYDNTRT